MMCKGLLGQTDLSQGSTIMVNSTTDIQQFCLAISNDVASLYGGLNLHFVVHNKSQLRDAIALSDHDLSGHPASETARSILRKQVKNDSSAFLGLAIASKSKYFGFKKEEYILGIFTINVDQFDNIKTAKQEILHLVWHAVDLYEIRQRPDYRNKFSRGAMIPKRSPLNLSKANLQADAFVCVYQSIESGTKQVTKALGQKRALQSLCPITHFKAENHPFVVAMEACELAVDDAMKQRTNSTNKLKVARDVSLDIGHAFDETSIKQWWKYALPAQDMAWRGAKPDEILGAALNTSDNPFVRSIAYLVDEILEDIEPSSASTLANFYNSYLDTEKVFNMHRELIDAAFEEAIAEGLKTSSPEAFMQAANKQNENLTDGKILGWCANALQNAGKAFDSALKSGTAPDQAARVNFKTTEEAPNWDSLKELGKKIIDEKREGFAITMGHIAEVCHNNPAFSSVLDSIKITMNDPSYIQKLEAANDLNFVPSGPAMNAPAPKGPAPKGPAPKGPEINGPAITPTPMPAPGMGGPGGGGNRSAQIMHQRKMMLEKQRQEELENSKKDKSDSE